MAARRNGWERVRKSARTLPEVVQWKISDHANWRCPSASNAVQQRGLLCCGRSQRSTDKLVMSGQGAQHLDTLRFGRKSDVTPPRNRRGVQLLSCSCQCCASWCDVASATPHLGVPKVDFIARVLVAAKRARLPHCVEKRHQTCFQGLKSDVRLGA